MESMKEQLITEINKTPAKLLTEVLDFVQFLNQKYLQPKPTPPKGWQSGFLRR